jgi:CheY-like chemotaxis protein
MSKRILIIDDEENLRRMMQLTLEAAGYESGAAGDGRQGLTLYADGSSWDAVLLDQRMPGMDGMETLARIKERRPEARVIMVTAYASIELAVQAMKLGATDFVRKPMTPQILRGALTAALARTTATPVTPIASTNTADNQPEIHTITLNGFEIGRASEVETMLPVQPDEHCFIVKDPEGKVHQVRVKIDEELVRYVERMTRRLLAADSSFWLLRAERFLSDYLWFEGAFPATGKLTLKEIDRDELLMAERWEG